MDEFEIISRYFGATPADRPDISCGIGDDAAIVLPSADHQWVVAVDTLVVGRHFPASIAPDDLGYRLAAVNLSDMAAMAARPRFATLAITLPEIDDAWLAAFSSAMLGLLNRYDCALVGGDTTAGPLTLSMQLIGQLDGSGLRRNGAKVGDDVWVSGTLGDARAALDVLDHSDDRADVRFFKNRFYRPTPRIELALGLVSYANAGIDISDGLIADLGHVANASGVAIALEIDRLPLSDALTGYCDLSQAQRFAATGGDDYELALTASPNARQQLLSTAEKLGVRLTRIGTVGLGAGVTVLASDGMAVSFAKPGYRHFE